MEAVVFTGIQGAGKTTFFKDRFFETHVRISLDMLKTRRREAVLLAACIEGKQSFVVDNTNPTAEDRRRYIEPAKDAGFAVIGYCFAVDLAGSKRRNQERTDKPPIPLPGLLGTHKRLQVPAYAEGYDRLLAVRIGSDGAFVVEDWVR